MMQRFVKTGLLVSIVILSLSMDARSEHDPVLDLIRKMQQAYAGLRDMQCNFVKDIVIEGRHVPRTVMVFKFKKTPKTIYLEFLNRFKGRKCLYIEGENDNRMLVRPEGILKFMTFKIDPLDERALEESTEPITQMGFEPIIETMQKWHTRSLTDDAVKIDFTTNFQENGVSCYRLYSRLTKNDDFLMILVDQKTHLPYKLQYLYGTSRGLFIYKGVEVNLGLTAVDFEI